ncbi:MAG: hypothetical protein E6R03_11325 [Hyphomicrobiaceae bacterium]|nr:MAG: hypothetical protein E6R03_11325 [Hyphomicrobiaceae bacterium]
MAIYSKKGWPEAIKIASQNGILPTFSGSDVAIAIGILKTQEHIAHVLSSVFGDDLDAACAAAGVAMPYVFLYELYPYYPTPYWNDENDRVEVRVYLSTEDHSRGKTSSVTPGKFLRMIYGDTLHEAEFQRKILDLEATVPRPPKLKFARTWREVQEVYLRCSTGSCMSYASLKRTVEVNGYEYRGVMPVAAYVYPFERAADYDGPDDNGFAIAYIGEDNRPSARSVVNQKTKRYGRVYGDQRLVTALESAGYKHSDHSPLVDMKCSVVAHDGDDGGQYIAVPYVDYADGFRIHKSDEHMVVAREYSRSADYPVFMARSSGGWALSPRKCRWCESFTSEYSLDDDDDVVCSHCGDDMAYILVVRDGALTEVREPAHLHPNLVSMFGRNFSDRDAARAAGFVFHETGGVTNWERNCPTCGEEIGALNPGCFVAEDFVSSEIRTCCYSCARENRARIVVNGTLSILEVGPPVGDYYSLGPRGQTLFRSTGVNAGLRHVPSEFLSDYEFGSSRFSNNVRTAAAFPPLGHEFPGVFTADGHLNPDFKFVSAIKTGEGHEHTSE